MGWNHELKYNLEDDHVKNKFILVETSMLESVWNDNFAEIVREFDENRWKTNLDGIKPQSNIIAFSKTSILTRYDKERILAMGELKMGDKDCSSIDSKLGCFTVLPKVEDNVR